MCSAANNPGVLVHQMKVAREVRFVLVQYMKVAWEIR
jgi:hypothetical protein